MGLFDDCYRELRSRLGELASDHPVTLSMKAAGEALAAAEHAFVAGRVAGQLGGQGREERRAKAVRAAAEACARARLYSAMVTGEAAGERSTDPGDWMAVLHAAFIAADDAAVAAGF